MESSINIYTNNSTNFVDTIELTKNANDDIMTNLTNNRNN